MLRKHEIIRAMAAANNVSSIDRGVSSYNVTYFDRTTRVNWMPETTGRAWWGGASAAFFEAWVTVDAFNTGDRNNFFAIFGTDGWPRIKAQIYSNTLLIYGGTLGGSLNISKGVNPPGGFTLGAIYYMAGGLDYINGNAIACVGDPATGIFTSSETAHTFAHTSIQGTLQFRTTSWGCGHGYGGSTNDYGLTGTLHNITGYRQPVSVATFEEQFNQRQMNPIQSLVDTGDYQRSEGFNGTVGASIANSTNSRIYNNSVYGVKTFGNATIAAALAGDDLT